MFLILIWELGDFSPVIIEMKTGNIQTFMQKFSLEINLQENENSKVFGLPTNREKTQHFVRFLSGYKGVNHENFLKFPPRGLKRLFQAKYT